MKKYNKKTLLIFSNLLFISLILTGAISSVIARITDNSTKLDFTNEIIATIFLVIICISSFKIIRHYDLKFNKYFKIYIYYTIFVYVGMIIFIMIKDVLYIGNIYFTGKALNRIMLINFLNGISMIVILINISHRLDKKDRSIVTMLTVLLMVLTLIYYIVFGGLSTLFSVVEEVKIEHEEVRYNIRLESFFAPYNDYLYSYYESVGFSLMKKIDKDNIPGEVITTLKEHYKR